MAEQSYGDWIRSNPPLPTKEYKKEHMIQQTAVDWFSSEIFNQFELLKSGIINDEEFRNGLLNKRDQFKKIENLQIMNSYLQGFSEGVAFATTPINKDSTSEQYYNETFKK